MDPDYQLALALQEQLAAEGYNSPPVASSNPPPMTRKPPNQPAGHEYSSLIDPSWEVIDPTPNVFVLFTQFDNRFFWNRLQSVIVTWSKRMTTCAGICRYEGSGGACTISLSEPLLKLRPRKDLIETLLHEMIHAYLFVTKNNRDRDGHGAEFHKHMYRINEDAGTKISVYHDFHDEVRLYKTHWWRCNGPCQNRRPYFGMVKRASNRAPGPNDRWFPEHERSCGGKFIKVREPDTKTKKKGQLATKSVPVSDIRNYGDKRKNNPFVREMPAHNVQRGRVNPIKTIKDVDKNQVKGGTLNKGGGTIVVNGNSQKEENPLRINNFKPFSGAGHSLASTSSQTSNVDDVPKTTLDETDQKIREQYANVRDFWTNKYTKHLLNSPESEATPPKRAKRSKSSDNSANLKVSETSRPKSASDEAKDETNCPICSKLVNIKEMNNHLDNCLEKSLDDDVVSLEDVIGSPGGDKKVNCLVCQKYLSIFELNQHLETCINNVFEDEFEEPTPKIQEIVDLESDNNSSSNDVAIIEDPEEPPIVIEEEVEETIVINPTPVRTDQNIVLCPCCPKMMLESEINAHLDACLSQSID